MAKRKTDKEFRKEVYDLVRDEYIFLDTYVNSYTKIEVKHNKCGNTYKVTPSHFLKGYRCPYCSSNAKKTDTQFKQEVFELVKDEYTFLDSYANNKTKLRVKHNECQNIYKVTPYDFLSGHRCPYCYGNHKKTDAQFKQEVKNLVGDEYTFLESYVNNHTKIKVKHNKCDHVYKVAPIVFLRGTQCPYCSANARKSNIIFIKQVQSLVGGEYEFLDNYIDNATKIRVKHNMCGNVYEVKPSNFLQGHRCPYCSESLGEQKIKKVLDSLNITYEAQKTFDDLKDNRLLSYDFYIPSQNILIEYQGQQHYQPVDHFGGTDRFAIQQKHDKLKSEYTKNHGYNLISVPYTEDSFSKIKKYLIKHGLKK